MFDIIQYFVIKKTKKRTFYSERALFVFSCLSLKIKHETFGGYFLVYREDISTFVLSSLIPQSFLLLFQ